MRKRVTWLLIWTLLMTTVLSGAVYATGDETQKETETGETTADGEEVQTLSTEPTENAEESLERALAKSPFTEETTVANGVLIGTTDVSGMTAAQAMDAVQTEVAALGGKTLTLTLDGADGVDPITAPVSELGLYAKDLSNVVMEAVTLGKSGNLIVRYKTEKDLSVSSHTFDLELAVNEAAVKNFVDTKTEELSIEPVEAKLERVGSGFEITDSKSGIEVNADETAKSIMTAMENWNGEDLTVAASAQIKEPRCTKELLSQITDKIGTFSTSVTGGAGKQKNLKTGAGHTTDVLIMPGESWSMHDALAPFSAENGYVEEIAYQNGGYVKEYGGGICQLATTLYNAALRAEVHISKRSNHSMIVNYTDWGLDATINDGGSKDLELTNDFDFPIYIEASVGGGYVTYTIWGKETRPANRTLKFYGVTLSEEYVPDEVTVDPSMAPGTENVVQSTSYPAAVCEAYKEVYVDGVLQEKIKLHTDKYRASARKVVKGPDAAAAPPESTEAPAESTPAPTEAPTEAPTAAPTEAPATAPAESPSQG